MLLGGVAGLGWWGTTHEAVRMEDRIRAEAAPIASGSVHGVTAEVLGRDIQVSGLADSEAERAELIRQYEALPGRRVVRDDLQILAPAKPFTTILTLTEPGTALTAEGHVSSEAARGTLAEWLGAETVQGLTLASGAPIDQLGLLETGMAALKHMVRGRADVTDGLLRVSGEVADPTQEAAVMAELVKVPPEMATASLTLLDDGKPAAWELDFSALTGAVLRGKLPKGFDLAALQGALGLASLTNEARFATTGDAAALPDLFGKLARWLPDLEALRVNIPAEGAAKVAASVGKGADLDLIREGMAADLGAVDLTVDMVESDATEGTERLNAATGQTERLTSGYWLPLASFTVDKATCQAQADTLLAETTVNFLSGSDRLDASALRVLNRLASVIAPCAGSGLKAEIGGHTDASGDPLANIGLSQRRADAVVKALTARGVAPAMLRAHGYGAAMPIADNSTEQGRAVNRRTTVIWSE
ncbi:OmpA family protein [Gemmobacter serpentinus]|uniref:OmpA family protein n=1 Tax=Gemmobacter serpentinus TaxID=2652247 RepID=UPI001CF663BD|nr:OmpA family protein [Gemmobacter serpentinus]